MIDTDKYNIDDGVIWIWNDDLDQKQGWVLWEYKECPNGHTVGDDPNKTYSPHHQVLPALIFECKIDERMEAIMDLPLILAEVKKLQDKITLMEMQYVGLEQAYYNSPAEIENKRLRELLVEAAHCIHEMEGMAYAEADPDDLAKHAMEFRGNVSTTIGADAPWGDEE